jgi:hypothetical protein
MLQTMSDAVRCRIADFSSHLRLHVVIHIFSKLEVCARRMRLGFALKCDR